VVSLVPAVTEMLFAIGAGSDVVGVSSFDRFPPEVATLPTVGALIDPDFERILTLRPTLVVVYGSQDALIARLHNASIDLYRYQHAAGGSLEHISRTMRDLGTRLGRAPSANAAALALEQELSDVRQRVGNRPRPSTTLVFGREPGALRGIYVSGGSGFLHELIETAGGRNTFADVARESVQASAETILARRPAVIIELRTTATSPDRVEAERAVWHRLAGVPAVRDGRITFLTDPAMSIPGPRIGHAARLLAAAIHP
jgi:iron complex transport system substrate-binding protein